MSDQPEQEEGWRRWLRYASEDLQTAQQLDEEGSSPRWICVMAQQAAEKAMKALLVERAIEFPRTHDVSRLLQLVPEGLLAESDSEELERLSAWAVAGRYPVDLRDATNDDADGALAIARAIVTDVRRVLNTGSDVGSAQDRA